MLVSVILINHNRQNDTRRAIESLKRFSPDAEIILVDNHSDDNSVEVFRRELPGVTLLPLDENYGFGVANNRGAEIAHGEYLLILNNDTELLEDTPLKLVTIMKQNEHIGALGPMIVNPDGSFQWSFGSQPTFLNEWRTRQATRKLLRRGRTYQDSFAEQFAGGCDVDWLTGAALMIPKKLFDQIGGFNESYFIYFEDADICKRIRNLGYSVRYEPVGKLIHYGGIDTPIRRPARLHFEYRKSEVLYYKLHNSVTDNLMLRAYLCVKYMLLSVIADASMKQTARKILSVVFRP
jgi:hypothetical protein